jgi:hypothetical protein
LIFGVLGWVLEKMKWPRPPMILGLVLGGLAESRLFLSMENYGLSWLLRPSVVVLIVIILSGILYSVLKGRKERRSKADGAAAMVEWQGDPKRVVNKISLLFSLCLVVVLCLALWQSRNFNFRAGLFPWAIGFPLLGLSLLQVGREMAGRSGSRVRHAGTEESSNVPPEIVRSGRETYSSGSSSISWRSGCLVFRSGARCAVSFSSNSDQRKSGG